MKSARTLVDFLRESRDVHKWDLAEMCLNTSEQTVARIEEALSQTPMWHLEGFAANTAPTSGAVQPPSTASIPSLPHHESFNGMNNLSLEELFPEIFSDFTDTALLDLNQVS